MTERSRQRSALLPESLPPRGLSRAQAAAYVGVSPTLFDRMVTDHKMPKPVRIYGRTVWDRRKVDAAFDALSGLPGEEAETDSFADWDPTAKLKL
jgi:predicted DNA-binding transcriptional regulator AlpA